MNVLNDENRHFIKVSSLSFANIASFKEINKKSSNKTLRKDIEGNNEEMLNIVKRYFHCG